MQSLSIISNNPFRVLGVFSNSPKKEIVANKGRINAFLKVGKNVEFPLDLNTLLPPLQRTSESVSQSEAQISLIKDQIKYTLFWFINATPIDKIAFNHLQAGDINSAIDIWNKKDCFSSLQNILICSLIRNDWKKVFFYADRLFREYAEDFINLMDSQLSITSIELIHLFIDTLFEEQAIDHKQFINCITTDTDWSNYIKDKLVQPLISTITTEIEKANTVKRDDYKARYLAGHELKKNTATALADLKRLVLATDMRYQMLADKLGLEILRCGIDYFNRSKEPDTAKKAMYLQKYALDIVVGKAAKDKCQENVDILQKVIDELPPAEVLTEDKAIKDELRKFCQLPDKICSAVVLLNNTKPYLQSIKTKLGVTNSFYLKISTQVVGNALHNVIEEVNDIQNKMTTNPLRIHHPFDSSRFLIDESPFEKELRIRKMLPILNEILKEAWNATKIMDTFDMESDFKINRYNQNRSALKKMCEQFGISTNNYTSQTTTSSSSSSDSPGCMIAFIGLVILACIAFLS